MRVDAFLECHQAVRRARALFFDFDGTLVDSNEIKWRAFEICFSDFPERLAEIMRYCRQNPDISRGDKFRYIYETILGFSFNDEVETDLHRRFNDATIPQVIAAPEIPGVVRFLERVVHTHVTGILSSTPSAVVQHIVEARGWRSHFAVIQGAPVRKAEWLAAYQREHGLQGQEVVYFGDTGQDARAARESNCVFIGVANPLLKKQKGRFVTDFRDLVPQEAPMEIREGSR